MQKDYIRWEIGGIIGVLLLIAMYGTGKGAVEGSLEKRVVVYSPHGKEMLSEFEQRFEEAYPGVDVRWMDMGSEDVLDRARSERRNPQGDVWWGAPSTTFVRAAQEGLLEPYMPSWADQIAPAFRDSAYRWVGTFQTPEVIAFNRDVLTREEAPQDWDDLLDPKWKDKIILRYPLASGTMRTIFGAIIGRFYRETGRPEKGYEWLLRLDANTKTYAANPTLMQQKIARREGILTLWNMPDIVLQTETYGYPFDFVFPRSGTVVLTDGLALIAGAKHLQAAKAFYEFITTPESFVVQASRFHRIPTRMDIPKEDLPAWMGDLSMKVMEVDWRLLAEKGKAWMAYWDTRIKGKGKTWMKGR